MTEPSSVTSFLMGPGQAVIQKFENHCSTELHKHVRISSLDKWSKPVQHQDSCSELMVATYRVFWSSKEHTLRNTTIKRPSLRSGLSFQGFTPQSFHSLKTSPLHPSDTQSSFGQKDLRWKGNLQGRFPCWEKSISFHQSTVVYIFQTRDSSSPGSGKPK